MCYNYGAKRQEMPEKELLSMEFMINHLKGMDNISVKFVKADNNEDAFNIDHVTFCLTNNQDVVLATKHFAQLVPVEKVMTDAWDDVKINVEDLFLTEFVKEPYAENEDGKILKLKLLPTKFYEKHPAFLYDFQTLYHAKVINEFVKLCGISKRDGIDFIQKSLTVENDIFSFMKSMKEKSCEKSFEIA